MSDLSKVYDFTMPPPKGKWQPPAPAPWIVRGPVDKDLTQSRAVLRVLAIGNPPSVIYTSEENLLLLSEFFGADVPCKLVSKKPRHVMPGFVLSMWEHMPKEWVERADERGCAWAEVW